MTLMFFMKPHYGGGGIGSGTGGGEHKRQIQIYEDWIYDKVQPKKAKVNPGDIHPYFRDRPELAPEVLGLLQQGFDLEEILLFFMMTEQ